MSNAERCRRARAAMTDEEYRAYLAKALARVRKRRAAFYAKGLNSDGRPYRHPANRRRYGQV